MGADWPPGGVGGGSLDRQGRVQEAGLVEDAADKRHLSPRVDDSVAEAPTGVTGRPHGSDDGAPSHQVLPGLLP